VPIASLGAFILFLGFLAFNGGSQLVIVGGAGNGAAVAKSFMNTMLGGAAGAMFALSLSYCVPLLQGETPFWSLLTCINGGLAGMVSLCCACNAVHQGTAFGIGACAGITMWWSSKLLKKLKIDDPLDAFAVHYGGGVVGLLMSPVFMEGGIVYFTSCEKQEAAINNPVDFECDYGPFYTFAWNLCGLVAITAWSGGLCAIMFALLNFLKLLRIDADIEVRGLDIKKHGEPGYPSAAYGHGWDSEGDFVLSNMNQTAGRAGGDTGRRGAAALMNPNKSENWDDTAAADGLIAMALGYRNQHYKAPENPE